MLHCFLGDLTNAEIAVVMDNHQAELEDALKRLDKDREQQAAALRQKLAERRRKKERDLHQKHINQVLPKNYLF